MVPYPYIHLPDYYTRLLRINMHSGGNTLDNLRRHIFHNPSFRAILENCFHDLEKVGSIDSIIKSLGWHGLRDRLANIFIEHQLQGKFPTKSNLAHTDELLQFEKSLEEYAVEGFSRAFLLAFYFKMSGSLGDISPHFQDVLEHLDQSKVKTVKIDWLLLLLSHFHHFLGADELNSRLKNKVPYKSIWSDLDNSQKEVLMESLLSYGCAINEPDTFCGTFVH